MRINLIPVKNKIDSLLSSLARYLILVAIIMTIAFIYIAIKNNSLDGTIDNKEKLLSESSILQKELEELQQEEDEYKTILSQLRIGEEVHEGLRYPMSDILKDISLIVPEKLTIHQMKTDREGVIRLRIVSFSLPDISKFAIHIKDREWVDEVELATIQEMVYNDTRYYVTEANLYLQGYYELIKEQDKLASQEAQEGSEETSEQQENSQGNTTENDNGQTQEDTEENQNRFSNLFGFGNECININTASKEELMTLDGITDDIANSIISNRPYLNGEDMASKSGLTTIQLRDMGDTICVK